MKLTSGKIDTAIKTVIYGPEGIGKSTLAAQFPRPVFIDTEGSTVHMDVRRTPRPQSWTELLEQVHWLADRPAELGTLVLDTADWAEALCAETVCARAQKSGIEEFGYGKGYTYLAEEFGRLLTALDLAKDRGVNIVITAHAKMRKFEQPDEMGAYDRWEMKLSKTCAPLIKEWADMVLFACYKTYVINVDGQGAQKGKNKAMGGERILRTTHNPCWDAKNRFALPEEMPLGYAGIAHLLRDRTAKGEAEAVAESATTAAPVSAEASPPDAPPPFPGVPEKVARLMRENGVTPEEVVYVVSQKGYFPADMAFRDYPQDFIDGWMLPCWAQIVAKIKENRTKVPF